MNSSFLDPNSINSRKSFCFLIKVTIRILALTAYSFLQIVFHVWRGVQFVILPLIFIKLDRDTVENLCKRIPKFQHQMMVLPWNDTVYGRKPVTFLILQSSLINLLLINLILKYNPSSLSWKPISMICVKCKRENRGYASRVSTFKSLLAHECNKARSL